MKILVTGAAGLIGSEIVEEHLSRGDSVIGIDNFFRDSSRNLRQARMSTNFSFFDGDIKTLDHYAEINSDLFRGIDVIYHMAAVVPTKYFYDGIIETFETNVLGTYKMLTWAKESDIKIFINGSSSEIYGHASYFKPTEKSFIVFETPEGTSRWSYAFGKLLMEHVGNEFTPYFKVCHMRFANCYGSRDLDDHHIIPYIINRLLQKETLDLLTTAKTARRSFVHGYDCARACILAMEHGLDGSYNIGTHEEITIYPDLVDKIVEKVGKTFSKACFRGARPGDPERRQLDTSKAREDLGWYPTFTLDEGLEETIEGALNK